MSNKKGNARSAARLAAVQALYQLEMEKPELHVLLDEFHLHRLGAEIEDVEYLKADTPFFDDVVKGVAARRDEIDALLADHLAQGWSIPRLDRTMVQILRAGAYELMARKDVTLMLDTADGLPLAVLPGVAARMDQLIAAGNGERDASVLAIEAVSKS